MISPAAHADELRARGFTVMPGLYGPESVALLRAALEDEYERAGRPVLHAGGHLVDTGSDMGATAAGFAVSRLLVARPDLARRFLEPDLVAVLRDALGDGVVIELAGGLLTDSSRPFFKWHNHVGGIEDHRWEGRTDFPRDGRPQRILVLVYLQPLTPAYGSLLVLPRSPGDPPEAPFALDARTWAGQVEVEAPAGTAVLLEQSTWHAALPQSADGLRMFLGSYYRAAWAPPGAGTDPTLAALDVDAPLLRAMLPR